MSRWPTVSVPLKRVGLLEGKSAEQVVAHYHVMSYVVCYAEEHSQTFNRKLEHRNRE